MAKKNVDELDKMEELANKNEADFLAEIESESESEPESKLVPEPASEPSVCTPSDDPVCMLAADLIKLCDSIGEGVAARVISVVMEMMTETQRIADGVKARFRIGTDAENEMYLRNSDAELSQIKARFAVDNQRKISAITNATCIQVLECEIDRIRKQLP